MHGQFRMSVCCLQLATIASSKTQTNELVTVSASIVHVLQNALRNLYYYSNCLVEWTPAERSFYDAKLSKHTQYHHHYH